MTTTHSIDPARLQSGTWCHRAGKTVNEGDISASYSADRIGTNEPLRRPFEWKGSLWVCTGKSSRGAKAYRLSHPQAFKGRQVTYREKANDGDAARSDPNGFYHGMVVKHGGRTYVLSGPPALLLPGKTAQMDLFGGQPGENLGHHGS